MLAANVATNMRWWPMEKCEETEHANRLVISVVFISCLTGQFKREFPAVSTLSWTQAVVGGHDDCGISPTDELYPYGKYYTLALQ